MDADNRPQHAPNKGLPFTKILSVPSPTRPVPSEESTQLCWNSPFTDRKHIWPQRHWHANGNGHGNGNKKRTQRFMFRHYLSWKNLPPRPCKIWNDSSFLSDPVLFASLKKRTPFTLSKRNPSTPPTSVWAHECGVWTRWCPAASKRAPVPMQWSLGRSGDSEAARCELAVFSRCERRG